MTRRRRIRGRIRDDRDIVEPVHISVILQRVLADAEAVFVLRLSKVARRWVRKRPSW